MNKDLKNHLKASLEKDVRVDGRNLQDHRDVTIEQGVISTAEGSARVTAGNAEVLAGVKIEARQPYPDTPNQGSIQVNVELLSLSSPEFESGRPGIESIEPSRVIDRGLRESGSIDLENLCIKRGEKVYGVVIDIVPINYDGNIYGLGGLAALAALKDLTFPALNDDGSIDHDTPSQDKTLELSHEPLPVTVYKVGDLLLVDPTSEEEAVTDARLTVTVLEDGTICSLQKGGEQPITTSDFKQMVSTAVETAEELRTQL